MPVGYETIWAPRCGDEERSGSACAEPIASLAELRNRSPIVSWFYKAGDKPAHRDVSFALRVAEATWQTSGIVVGMEYIRKEGRHWTVREGKTAN